MTEHRRCGAKTRNGAPCQHFVAPGFTRCRLHGGALPQAKLGAARRLADQHARKLLADLGHVEPITDPIAALEDLAGQAKTLVDLLRIAVSDLEEIRYKGGLGQGTENVRGELQSYLAAMQRAESILGRIVSLNLDERRVRVQEVQAEIVLQAIGRAMDSVELPEDARQGLTAAIAQELRVDSGSRRVPEPVPALQAPVEISESEL